MEGCLRVLGYGDLQSYMGSHGTGFSAVVLGDVVGRIWGMWSGELYIYKGRKQMNLCLHPHGAEVQLV